MCIRSSQLLMQHNFTQLFSPCASSWQIRQKVRQTAGNTGLWSSLGVYMAVIWIAPGICWQWTPLQMEMYAFLLKYKFCNHNTSALSFIYMCGSVHFENKQQKSMHMTSVGFPMGSTRICSGVVISDTYCVCLLWRWWGRWRPFTWCWHTGSHSVLS